MASFFLIAGISVSASAQQVSDKIIKKNTVPLSGSLAMVTKLTPVEYEYNQQAGKPINLPAGKRIGFISEDVKQIYPAAVTTKHNWVAAGKGSQRAVETAEVDPAQLVPLLVAAMKEQQAQIDALRQEVQQLKSK